MQEKSIETKFKKSERTKRFADPSEVEPGKLWSAASVLCVLIAWTLASYFDVVSDLFLPSPLQVLEEFYSIGFTEGYRGHNLWGHIGISLYRVFAGWGLGCLIGIPVGIGMGINTMARGLADPLIELYRPVPPLAYIPLIIIWFGIGDDGKIILLFLASFSIIVINSRSGVKSAGVEKIHAAFTLGANHWQVVRRVILPNALPEILTGMRVAMGIAWATLVAAEMVAAKSGIGWMVLNAARYLRTDIVIMGIVVMGVTGYFIDMGMRYMEKRLIPWKGKL